MALSTMQHFSRPQHPHPTVLHADAINPAYLCQGCMTYGSGQRYHCHACTFNLHEYCRTCPQSLSSFMHPNHSLMLQLEPDHMCERDCNICHDPIEGISYRCELCEFNVHPICTQLPETLNHILHQAHPLSLLLGSAGTCAVCSGACDASFWRYGCKECGFDVHIDCVLVECEKKTRDRGIVTYVPPPVLYPQQPYFGGYGSGIPYSRPLNTNHNYMTHPQPQYPNHEIPYWPPSTSSCFPSPLNINHNNMPQPQPQLQHQNHGIPYWQYPSPNLFPGPSNMHHNNYNMPQYPQLDQQNQHQGKAQTHNGGSGRGIGRVIFNLVKATGTGLISSMIFGADVSQYFFTS